MIITLFDLSSSHVFLQSSTLNIKAGVLPMNPACSFDSTSSTIAAFGTLRIISVHWSFGAMDKKCHPGVGLTSVIFTKPSSVV